MSTITGLTNIEIRKLEFEAGVQFFIKPVLLVVSILFSVWASGKSRASRSLTGSGLSLGLAPDPGLAPAEFAERAEPPEIKLEIIDCSS